MKNPNENSLTKRIIDPVVNLLSNPHFTSWIGALSLILSVNLVHAQDLVINEFLASNEATNVDEFNEADDWIEIYNPGISAVDIGGYYLTDDLSELDQWQIPDTNSILTTIPAGGYLLLWADKDQDQGVLHIGFKLGSSGEQIGLILPDGITIVDSLSFGVQANDVSQGRSPNGGNTFAYFTEPTPSGPNLTTPNAPQVEPVEFSIQGGIHSTTLNLQLATETSDAIIYYTTDGSVPTTDDFIYEDSIIILSNTPLRVRAFLPPLQASPIATQTYLFNIAHSFPVVAYTADSLELFAEEGGMYTDHEEDIEINANVELYETDGTQGFNQLMESEINGVATANLGQKSLALKAKKSLGKATIDYPIFPNESLTEYRSLILRNNGQDWNKTHFRDAMVSGLVREISDVSEIIEKPIIYGQAFRPSIVYINGQYWGMHNIRERIDKRYLKNRFDLDEEEVDLLENRDKIKTGDLIAWNEFKDFYENSDFSDNENFMNLADRMEVDHYRDYIVFNLFIDNYDWPGNNNRHWRKRAAGEKWRWLTYDLDFSFGMFSATHPFNSGYFGANSLDRLLTASPNNKWPNQSWAVELFGKIIENKGWRDDLINRMADQMNVLFTPERMNARISGLETLYAPEMQQHHDRWSSGFEKWSENLDKLRSFSEGRPAVVYDFFQSTFPDITGTNQITVNINDTALGSIRFNTIRISDQHHPFSGTYFGNIPIPVQALPNRGYMVENWSGALSGSNPNESLILDNDETLTAHFAKGSSASDPIVINEINYNSSNQLDAGDWVELFNPTASEVDLSGWYMEDESGNYFPIPNHTILPSNSYLILAEDIEKFQAYYPNVTATIGSFGKGIIGFGLSKKGELLTLKNADHLIIDEVDYDDENPWPEAPDGSGATLQLLSPELDNSLPENWKGTNPTPGEINELTTVIEIANCDNILWETTDSTLLISQVMADSFSVVLLDSNMTEEFLCNNCILPIVIDVLIPQTYTLNLNLFYGSTDTLCATEISDFLITNRPSQITVIDPQDMTIQVLEGLTTATVSYSAPIFTTDCENDGLTIVQNSGPENGENLLPGTYTVGHKATDSCGNEMFANFNITILEANNTGPTVEYCEAKSEKPWQEYIQKVRLGLINNTSSKCDTKCGYGDFSNLSTNVNTGTNYLLTLTPGLSWSGQDADLYWRVWIDFNQDKNFTDANEQVLEIYGGREIVNQVISIPANVNLGLARMRITAKKGSYATSCETFEKGEVEDYSINILAQNNSCTQYGQPCDDGDDCTTEDLYDVDCNCAGTFTDSDQDGVCDIVDTCPGFDDHIDTDNNGIPDGCEPIIGDPNCVAEAERPWNQYIHIVKVGDLENTSSKCYNGCGYSDFTELVTDLTIGESYPITLTAKYSYNNYDEYWRVWIDFNGDEIFTADEKIVETFTADIGSGIITHSVENNFTIPTSTPTGIVRMRVALRREGFPEACGEFENGEVEDYSIQLINGSSTQSAPPTMLPPAPPVATLHETNDNLPTTEILPGLINVYPNPATSSITIDLTNYQPTKGSLIIIDESGRALLNFPLEKMIGTRTELNLSRFERGAYFIDIQPEKGKRTTTKFIVIK